MSTTFRRDRLKRLAENGKLVRTGSYHFDDQMGSERVRDGEAPAIPVRITTGGGDFKEGFCNVYTSDFTGNCGRAWLNKDGTVTLYVHSNCNYTFRIVK